MEMQKTNGGFTPLSENDLAQKITAIRKKSNSLMADIKIASINAVYQSVEHGRTNYANDLMAAVPKGLQRPLLTFFQQYGRIQMVKDETTKTKVLAYDRERQDVPKPQEGKAADYVAHIDTTWINVKPKRQPKAIEVFNPVLQLDKFVAGLHRQLTKVVAQRNSGQEVQEIHTDIIKDLEIFMAKWKTDHGIMTAEPEIDEEDDAEKLTRLQKELEAAQKKLAKYEPKSAEDKKANANEEMKESMAAAIEGKGTRKGMRRAA